MDHAEALARAVVEAVEAGSRMRHQTKQSHGEHDFDLVYGDGRIAALEVTAAADKQAEGMVAAILEKSKGGPFVPTQLCKQGWYLHPGRGAIINKIRALADKYLADVEAEGLTRFFSPSDAVAHDSVRRIWNDLGVLSGSVMKWKTPGQIGISPPDGGGAVGIGHFVDAVRLVAEKTDNRCKLARAATQERHLFVYIQPRNYLAWVAFSDLSPPSEPVTLPEEITHVWAVTEGRTLNEFLVWRARRGEHWQDCGPLTLVLTDSAPSGELM